MPVASMVSFRLGGPDGVSVQAATWGRALERLGYTVRPVAGELSDGLQPGDVVVPGLAVTPEAPPGPDGQRPPAPQGPDPDELGAALDRSAVVVVENVLSLPLHPEAARILTRVLGELPAGVRVILHHHDLAWQRPETAQFTGLPPRLPGAVHVTINDFSRRELAERGIPAVTVRNAFDLDAPTGRRNETREALGLRADELLVLQPTRATAHKNIPAALRLAEGLAEVLARPVVYWLPGPTEDGYATALAEAVAATTVPVLRDTPGSLRLGPHGKRAGMADAYAACDLVTFTSIGGEGFGQPVIESVWANRPLAVLGYPALEEIIGLGFSFLPADDPEAVAAALREASWRDGLGPVATRNRELAQAHFSMKALERALEALLRLR